MKLLWGVLATAVLFVKPCGADESSLHEMYGDLDLITHQLHVQYAPAEWKRSYSGWDLDAELSNAKNRLAAMTPHITLKDYHQVVKDFLGSMNDYHVSVSFSSTESASLPFSIKGAEGHYYISSIDTDKLTPNYYAIAIGDEILLFDGLPVSETIESLKWANATNANPATDQRLAELALTSRSGVRGDFVPRGTVSITIWSNASNRALTYQLIWRYEPEQIAIRKKPNSNAFKGTFQACSMLSPLYNLFGSKKEIHSPLGARESDIPFLGNPDWISDYDYPFHAYIYTNAEGKKIGYIRIPSYRGFREDVIAFGGALYYLQRNTDALVIDQIDNPGGYVPYMYALASMLTDSPLVTPQHRLTITQQDVLKAIQELEILTKIETEKEAAEFFAQLGEVGGTTSYQMVQFEIEFCRFIINEWNEGRTLTNPIYIQGIDQINPHPQCQYTKPILFLVNELDFSGGDFMPAILQDNNRATIFGTRTAGAGGFIASLEFYNRNGIDSIHFTRSIAERPNKLPIENLGVTPDITYSMAAEDLQYGYKGYMSAVNAAISRLLADSEECEPASDSECSTENVIDCTTE